MPRPESYKLNADACRLCEHCWEVFTGGVSTYCFKGEDEFSSELLSALASRFSGNGIHLTMDPSKETQGWLDERMVSEEGTCDEFEERHVQS